MLVKTYWLEKRISLRSFLLRYKGYNELSLQWSQTVALGYYCNLVGKEVVL